MRGRENEKNEGRESVRERKEEESKNRGRNEEGEQEEGEEESWPAAVEEEDNSRGVR